MNGDSPAAGAAAVSLLAACGIRDVVLSPGSRSAPLAMAAAHAEAGGLLDLHVRVDERSAGFLALGLAKVAARPVAVVCTSGTAVANLLPAVVEARYAGVPLVLLTADRPPELRGRGASQTIDQVGIFDRFVAGSVDLSTPAGVVDEGEWLDALRCQVELSARVRMPVHVNMPFPAPLVGSVAVPAPPAPPAPSPGTGPVRPQPVDLGDVPARGLIVAGDLDVWDETARQAIAGLGTSCGWPIVAEASANVAGAATAIRHGTLLAAAPELRAALRPEFVLTVGPFGLDRGVVDLVRSAQRHVAVRLRPRTDPPDPVGTAELVVDAMPRCRPTLDHTWLERWREADARAAGVIRELLASPGPPTVAAVAATVSAALSPGDLLLAASSLTIRHLASFGSGHGGTVIANRGANGIDGLVSTAWGSALVWQRQGGGRAFALLGDLATLHDRNGLWVPAVEARPDLTLVVADNNGGGIFGTLEQGGPQYRADFDRVFGTPHDRDIGAELAAAGLQVSVVDTVWALAAAVARNPEPPGVRAVVVRTAPAEYEAELLRALVAALPATPGQ